MPGKSKPSSTIGGGSMSRLQQEQPVGGIMDPSPLLATVGAGCTRYPLR
jgi:hypothetical protein